MKVHVICECYLTLCVMCVQSAYWLVAKTSALNRGISELQQQLLLQLSEFCELRSGQSSEVPPHSESVPLIRIETLIFIILSASVDQMQTFGMLKLRHYFCILCLKIDILAK